MTSSTGSSTRAIRAPRSPRRHSSSCAKQPTGDGSAFRNWITTDPFGRGLPGADLLTFHGAKGRGWHTVYLVDARPVRRDIARRPPTPPAWRRLACCTSHSLSHRCPHRQLGAAAWRVPAQTHSPARRIRQRGGRDGRDCRPDWCRCEAHGAAGDVGAAPRGAAAWRGQGVSCRMPW